MHASCSSSPSLDQSDIVQTAKRKNGFPYLWYGREDCASTLNSVREWSDGPFGVTCGQPRDVCRMPCSNACVPRPLAYRLPDTHSNVGIWCAARSHAKLQKVHPEKLRGPFQLQHAENVLAHIRTEAGALCACSCASSHPSCGRLEPLAVCFEAGCLDAWKQCS